MDEAWERAVEAALEGNASSAAPRTLTLDGAVKCVHGRLPAPRILERFQTLQHLSIANVGVSSLDQFPRLRNLQRLILSDNRIAAGLEFLVDAGLDSLRDLDLSNNRIQSIDDLAPLANLRLVSLDLYECPVTRISDYRSRVFGLIRSLKYLDKMDADENERPETDDEEDEEEEEDDEEEEEDPGSGEIDGEDRSAKLANGVAGRLREDDVVDVDEDDESDADEEEIEMARPVANGSASGSRHHLSNGFHVVAVGDEDEDDEEEDVDDEDDDEDDDDDFEEADGDPVEEIDEDGGEEEANVVEVLDIGDSDDDADGIEEEEEAEEEGDDEVDGDDGEDEEDVEDGEEDGEPGSTARLMSTDGEIDEHEQGEDDEDGEIGEEDEQGVEEEQGFDEDDVEVDDEDDDLDGDYLLQQHVPQVEVEAGQSDFDVCNVEDEDEEEDDEVDDDQDEEERVNNGGASSSSQPSKRKRDEGADCNDDCVEDLSSSKHR